MLIKWFYPVGVVLCYRTKETRRSVFDHKLIAHLILLVGRLVVVGAVPLAVDLGETKKTTPIIIPTIDIGAAVIV